MLIKQSQILDKSKFRIFKLFLFMGFSMKYQNPDFGHNISQKTSVRYSNI